MIDKTRSTQIAETYYKDVYSYCLSYVDCSEDEAEEVTQEVFLVFQQKLDQLDDINIRAWLMNVAKNKVREHFRKMKKAEKLVPLSENIRPTEEMYSYLDEYFNAEAYVSDADILKCKELILKSLSKSDQQLYIKVFVEKKKYRQVAEELNTNEKAVNVRVFRLKEKLKKLAAFSLSTVGQLIIKIFF